MAAEVFGRLIQIHDVTHGRSLVEHRSLMRWKHLQDTPRQSTEWGRR